MSMNEQASCSFGSLPQNALSAIHDILLHASDDNEGTCKQPGLRDAAAFRSVCKAFCGAVVMPHTLKLSFDESLLKCTTSSLALMLSKPCAAHTRLSLRLYMRFRTTHEFFDAATKADMETFSLCEDASAGPPSRLADVAPSIVCMEAPSLYAGSTVAAACRGMPGCECLVLHLRAAPNMQGASLGDRKCWEQLLGTQFGRRNTPSHRASQSNVPQSTPPSQLRSLTLIVPPGEAPYPLTGRAPPSYRGRFKGPLLDLSGLPAFRHLRLVGPLVKQNCKEHELPFVLPPAAKVTVDPGLGGRQPTQWARTLTEYESAGSMPGTAIPSLSKYMEEDQVARQERMRIFMGKVGCKAFGMWEKGLVRRRCEHGDDLDEYAVESLKRNGRLKQLMASHGIEGRSDLLDKALNADALARTAVSDFESHG